MKNRPFLKGGGWETSIILLILPIPTYGQRFTSKKGGVTLPMPSQVYQRPSNSSKSSRYLPVSPCLGHRLGHCQDPGELP